MSQPLSQMHANFTCKVTMRLAEPRIIVEMFLERKSRLIEIKLFYFLGAHRETMECISLICCFTYILQNGPIPFKNVMEDLTFGFLISFLLC